jgi:hypothetical protein
MAKLITPLSATSVGSLISGSPGPKNVVGMTLIGALRSGNQSLAMTALGRGGQVPQQVSTAARTTSASTVRVMTTAISEHWDGSSSSLRGSLRRVGVPHRAPNLPGRWSSGEPYFAQSSCPGIFHR